MNKSFLIPVQKPEDLIDIGFGEYEYDILTKDDIELSMKIS